MTEVTRDFDGVRALDGVSMRVGAGEIVAVLGPNGAGKTTLLRTVAGLVAPTSGTVEVLGGGPHRRDIRRDIGWLPSGERSVYLRLSGRENLRFFLRLEGLAPRAAVAAADHALRAVALDHVATKQTHTYSHGMQRRLALARAVAVHYPVLLLDEVAHDLDPDNADRARALVHTAAQRGATVLWATHRIDEVDGFASRVVVLDHGRVRSDLPTRDFLALTPTTRFAVQIANPPSDVLDLAVDALGPLGSLGRSHDERFLLSLAPTVALGEAVTALYQAGIRVVGCDRDATPARSAYDSVLSAVP